MIPDQTLALIANKPSNPAVETALSRTLTNIGQNTAICIAGSYGVSKFSTFPEFSKVTQSVVQGITANTLGEIVEELQENNESNAGKNAAKTLVTSVAAEATLAWAAKRGVSLIGLKEIAAGCLVGAIGLELINAVPDPSIQERIKGVKASSDFLRRVNHWTNTTAKNRVREFNAEADPISQPGGSNNSAGTPHNMWGGTTDSGMPSGGGSQDSMGHTPGTHGHNHGDHTGGAPTGNPHSNDGSNYTPPPPEKDEEFCGDFNICIDEDGNYYNNLTGEVDNPNPEDDGTQGGTSKPTIGPAPGDVGGRYSHLMNPGSERGGRPSPDDDNGDGPFGFGPTSGGDGNGTGGGPSGPGSDRSNADDDYGCDPLTGGGLGGGGTQDEVGWNFYRRPPKKGGGGQYGDSGTGFDDLYKPNPEDDYGVGGPSARLWNSTESVDALVAGQSSGTSTEMFAEPAFAPFGVSFDSFTPSKDVFGAGFEVASDLQSANSFAPAKADFTKELAMV